MKKITKFSIILIALLMIAGLDSFAQRGRGMTERRVDQGTTFVCQYIPNLTEDQQEQLSELRTEHLKEMQEYRNKINENRARYRTLVTQEPADRGAINEKIDEYTELKNQMMKLQAAHRQQIREQLTEEQKVYFDARAGRRGSHAVSQRRPGGRGHSGHPQRTPGSGRGW